MIVLFFKKNNFALPTPKKWIGRGIKVGMFGLVGLFDREMKEEYVNNW